MMRPFEIRHEGRFGEASVLAVAGELDVATAPTVDQHGQEALVAGRPLVLDLSGCTFLDSTGARSLGLLARSATQAGLAACLVVPPARRLVHRVVDHVGLARVVRVVEALDQALKAVPATPPDGVVR